MILAIIHFFVHRTNSPTPGPYSFISEVNITEPSYHIPTDLDSTVTVVNYSSADSDFVVTLENSNTYCETTVSVQTHISRNTPVDYDHDFNHLLFIGTNRTSTPKNNESPPQSPTIICVTNVNEESNNPSKLPAHSPSNMNIIADSHIIDSPRIIDVNEENNTIRSKSAKIARKEKKEEMTMLYKEKANIP